MTVRFDATAYRDHFGIAESEPLDLPDGVPGTLTSVAGPDAGYELKVTETEPLPPRVRAMAEAADASDPLLVGTVEAGEFTAGQSRAVELKGLPPVQFRKMRDITAAALEWAEYSVLNLALPLVGVLALWLGVVKIAERGGLVNIFVRAIRPLLGRLFPEIPKDHPALGMIALNFGANILGLGNAATPMGIKAMQEMQKLNPKPDTATNSMCMFLAMNTASVMLVPPAMLVGVMGLATGQLWVPIIIVTGLSLLVAIAVCRSLQAIPAFKANDPHRSGDPENPTDHAAPDADDPEASDTKGHA